MPDHHTADAAKTDEAFVRLLSRHEPVIRAYLRSVLPSAADVDVVMPEVALVAWRKFPELAEREAFPRWACVIARYEVLRYRRDKARDRFLLDEDVLAKLADETFRAGCSQGQSRARRRRMRTARDAPNWAASSCWKYRVASRLSPRVALASAPRPRASAGGCGSNGRLFLRNTLHPSPAMLAASNRLLVCFRRFRLRPALALLVGENVREPALEAAQDLAQAAQGDALVAAFQPVQSGRRHAELLGKLGVGLLPATGAEESAELLLQRRSHPATLAKAAFRMWNISGLAALHRVRSRYTRRQP